MSVPYFGDFDEDATVYIPFNTFSSNDPAASVTITNLADADLNVHKDGSTTQIVTDGATIAINFDAITGNHLATIDTSAHADYSTGSDYIVRMEGTTVDAGTINAWIGSFSIENRHNATQSALILTDTEAVLVDTEAVITDTEAILADTNELQGDWTNTGRLDTILDAVLVDTETVATVITDTEAILADTNELQGDWTNTGRLDTILDAVLVDTETVATVITDTEALLVDTEAIIIDTEAIITDTEAATGVLTDTEAIITDTENLNLGIIYGVTEAGTLSTTQATTDLTGFVDDELIGRVVIFTGGDADGQASDLTDYASASGLLTFTAITTLPAAADSFKIV